VTAATTVAPLWDRARAVSSIALDGGSLVGEELVVVYALRLWGRKHSTGSLDKHIKKHLAKYLCNNREDLGGLHELFGPITAPSRVCS
jgi:hypothetical protein